MIVTREEPQLLAFLKIQNLVDGMFQFVERHLHQLVARIVLENLDHVSAGVAGWEKAIRSRSAATLRRSIGIRSTLSW